MIPCRYCEGTNKNCIVCEGTNQVDETLPCPFCEGTKEICEDNCSPHTENCKLSPCPCTMDEAAFNIWKISMFKKRLSTDFTPFLVELANSALLCGAFYALGAGYHGNFVILLLVKIGFRYITQK